MTKPLVHLLVVLVMVALVVGIPGDASTQASPVDVVAGQSTNDVILALNQLAQGLPGAELVMSLTRNLLGDGGFVRTVLQELDLNGDGILTFDEVLGANVLDVARRVEQRLFEGRVDQGFEVVVGDDTTLNGLIDPYRRQLAADLALGAGNESAPPGLPIRSLKGDATGVIAALPRAALTAVSDRVADLDVRAFPAGDMTSPDMGVNAQRKALLMGEAQRLFPLLEADRWGALRTGLGQIRMRATGPGGQRTWVTGPKARGLVAKIDELLQVLPQ